MEENVCENNVQRCGCLVNIAHGGGGPVPQVTRCQGSGMSVTTHQLLCINGVEDIGLH